MRAFRHGIIPWLAFCFLLRIASASDGALRDADPPTNPALVQGTLSNGFRYLFLPRQNEADRVSLRLVVHAGSLDEHDDELGYAHFVEHMAFNGTTHYPPGKLVKFFQRIGLAWGGDATADTSFTSTIYKIDLPRGQSAHLPEALEVLSDYAGGILFDEAEVRRERGVILSELRARDTDESQVRAKLISSYYAGTSFRNRLPIGDAKLIGRAEATGLRRYYERCYRPERMTLVIVGNVDAAKLPGLMEKSFHHLRGRGLAIPQVLPGSLTIRGPQADIVISPLSQAATLSLVAIEPMSSDTIASVESALGTSATLAALERRLSERQALTAARIGRAESVAVAGLDDRYFHYGLEATAKQTDWPFALGFIETELRRACEQGFTAAELQEVTVSTLARLQAEAAEFSGKTADQIATSIASMTAAGRSWRAPATLLALAEHYFSTFTPASATERLRSVLSPERLHIVLQSQAVPEGGSKTLLAAYHASEAERLPDAHETAAALEFRYADFGSAGSVVEQKTEARLGIEQVRFSNGVRLNLRPSTVEPHRFRLSARVGRGTADVPRDQPGINYLATALMICCDLNRHTRDDFRRLTALRAVEGNWQFDDNDFVIELTGPSEQLPFALQTLTARISDLKLEAGKLSEAVSLYPALMGSMLNSVSGYTRVETMLRATDEDPRCRIPSPSEFAAYPFEKVAAWMRARWLEGPLEVGVAGDFKIDDAVAAAAASIGTLTPRSESSIEPTERLKFRAKPYRNLTNIDLPDKAADVRFFWRLPNAIQLPAYRAAQFANAALQDRVSDKLRQELGVTYSPIVMVYRSSGQPDFGLVVLEMTFEPSKAVALAERTIALAREFAEKGLTKEEFNRLRAPLRVAALAELRSNEWWLANVLQRVQSQPGVLEEAETHGTAFDTVTREEVNRAAKAIYLGNEANCVGFIPRAAPTSTTP